ncbi:MAG: alpha/beta fold hydrolase [Pirellulaceae bacterium]
MIYPELIYYPGHHADRLAARVWRTAQPIGDVVCLHGIISHGGWYESSCSHLASRGFRVHFLERRGSGLNSLQRGEIDHWTTWVEDVVQYIKQIDGRGPTILLGISWGAILATSIARRHADMLAGLALICPGLFSFKAANRFQRLALRMADCCGLRSKRVAVPLREPSLFTNSAQRQRYIAEDPFALRTITINFAINNLALLKQATDAPEEIELPVLLMLASSDPITDNASTRAFVERMHHPDRTIIEYANASHTLEFEDDPSQYFKDLADWCRRQSSSTT